MGKNKSLGSSMDRLFHTADQGALMPNLPAASYEQVKMIGLSHIEPSFAQPRKFFDDKSIQELAASIAQQGVIQPIILREESLGAYVIIAGERRYRAAKKAGLTKIPSIVRSYDDKDASLVALVENIQRENLNPLDRAQALFNISSEYKLKQQDLANLLGMSRTQLSNSLRLLKLHESVKEALMSKEITEGHAKVLAGLSLEEQEYYCYKVEKSHLSVRQLEDRLEKDRAESEHQPKKKKRSVYLNKMQSVFEERLLTKVNITDNGKGKGKVVLYFNSYDELSAISDNIIIDKDLF